MKLLISIVIILSIFFITFVESIESKERLSRTNARKIKKIADFISNELKAKEITNIRYEDITDTRGKKTMRARLISGELKKQLINNHIVLSDKGEVKVKGILIRFRDDPGKYKLQIDVFMPDGSMITSYTGIIRW